MGKRINFQPVSVSGPTTLLNGAFASLSGPVGFTPTQPRITVKRITVVHNGNNFSVLKNGVTVFSGPIVGSEPGFPTFEQLEQDVILDASDFLTATSNSTVIVNISAEIEF